jgi:hypothetical protein
MIREIAVTILIASILSAGCIAGQSPEKGTLQLTSSPSGAEIYLDSQYKGTTPSTISGIEPGNHTLEFRANGYTGYKAVIMVPLGITNYFAALSAKTTAPQSYEPISTTATVPVNMTLQVGRERMIVGDSNVFSGSTTGTGNVILTLFGPGFYENGVALGQVKPNAINSWSYIWNPGTSIQSGTYTIVVTDLEKTVEQRADFTAIGNGEVTVTPSSYAVSRGDTITFSGRCTTGAQNVQLSLFGPERFSSGVDLGTFAVMADKTWSFKYTLDSTLPTGMYTLYVYDMPRTTSSSTRFTVGFTS